ncbi:MAG: hypothetical protein K2K76_04030 [Muribaculaceae bacterium]|nr:hypothetical protein [Muribaculaceae bacterium]
MENPPQERGSTAVLTTQVFRVELGAINRVAFRRVMRRCVWFAALPVVVLLIAGIAFDRRWLFMIPMLMCLVYPFVAVMAAWSQTATPDLAQSTRPHYVRITRRGIEIVPVADDITPDTRTVRYINAGDVSDTALSGQYVVLFLRGGSFMLIPLGSVENPDALIDTADSLVSATIR